MPYGDNARMTAVYRIIGDSLVLVGPLVKGT